MNMMRKKTDLLAVAMTLSALGCAGTKLASSGDGTHSQPVKTIVVVPGGGVLADALAVELSGAGFKVVDSNQMSDVLGRLLEGRDSLTPQNLEALRTAGVDAYMTVRAILHNDLPQSASVLVCSTRSGEVLAGVSWQNGWTSPYPGIKNLRKDFVEAAREISRELNKRLEGYRAAAA